MKRGRNDDTDHEVKKVRCNENNDSFRNDKNLSKNAISQPAEGIQQLREKLMRELDPHLQANILIKYSTHAISPSAKTNTAIDFLFGFLQRHQNSATDKLDLNTSGTPTVAHQPVSTDNAPVIVGAIVRGLRQLLLIKTSAVQPMIQVDAMGEQLTQCFSISDNFKLRQDMLLIVTDSLLVTGKFKEVEKLCVNCFVDHNSDVEKTCLKTFLRLHHEGYVLSKKYVARVFDMSANILLNQTKQEYSRVYSARLLTILSQSYASLDVTSQIFPDLNNKKLIVKIFYVLCIATNDSCLEIKHQAAKSLWNPCFFDMSTARDALQKSQTVDNDAFSITTSNALLLSRGVLLSLVENKDAQVVCAASRAITSFCLRLNDSKSVQQIISFHFDLILDQTSTALKVLSTSLCRLVKFYHSCSKEEYVLLPQQASAVLGVVCGCSLDTFSTLLEAILECDISNATVSNKVIEFTMGYSFMIVNLPHEKLRFVTELARKLGEKLSRYPQSKKLLFSRFSRTGEKTQRAEKNISLSILQGAGLYPHHIADGEGYQSFCSDRVYLKRSISELLSETQFRRISSKENRYQYSDRLHAVLFLPAGENTTTTLCHAVEMYLKLLKAIRNPQTWDSSLEGIQYSAKLLVRSSLLSLACCDSMSFQRKVILLYFGLLGEIIVAMEKFTQEAFCRWISAETTRVLIFIRAEHNAGSSTVEAAIKELSTVQSHGDVLRICSNVTINGQSLNQVMHVTHRKVFGTIQQSEELTDDLHDLVIKGSIHGLKQPCNVFVQAIFPDGFISFRKVSWKNMKWRGRSRYEFESKAALQISSLSDPSEVQISLCLHFSELTGVKKENYRNAHDIPSFEHVEISKRITIPISAKRCTK